MLELYSLFLLLVVAAQWSIMFGPDICGYSTKKVHAILTRDGKNHLIKKDVPCTALCLDQTSVDTTQRKSMLYKDVCGWCSRWAGGCTCGGRIGGSGRAGGCADGSWQITPVHDPFLDMKLESVTILILLIFLLMMGRSIAMVDQNLREYHGFLTRAALIEALKNKIRHGLEESM